MRYYQRWYRLAQRLFQCGNLPPVLGDLAAKRWGKVADLQRLGDDPLRAIGKEPLPKPRWQRHQQLPHKGEQERHIPDEQTQLAALREAADRFVTRRFDDRSRSWTGDSWCLPNSGERHAVDHRRHIQRVFNESPRW